MVHERPWHLIKCGCWAPDCQYYNIVDKNGLLPENEDSLETGVLSGGWAKVDERTTRFIVESVNGLNPNPEGFSLPWQTKACFSELAGEACWCFEIHDKNGNIVCPEHGLKFLVEKK